MKRLSRAVLFLDATSIILMDKLDCLRHLDCVGAQAAISTGVLDEARLSASSDGLHIEGIPAVRLRDPPKADILLDETLGRGERESIALCLEDPKWRILVSDDRRAQKRAVRVGVQTIDSRALLWTMCTSRRISVEKFCGGVRYMGGLHAEARPS